MFKNYIFDLYGTLIDIHTDENKDELWEKLALFYGFGGAEYSPSELRKAYLQICGAEERMLPEKGYPEIEITNVFRSLYQRKSVEAGEELAVQTGKLFRVLSLEYIRLYDGVTELLEALKNAGKGVYLLSNAQRIFTEPEMKLLRLTNYFDGIVYSSDRGCKKPSPLFFQAIIDRYHLDKKESIMIGNDPFADIKGAHEAGLSSLYIHSNLSPEDTTGLLSNYKVMDGNVAQIKKLILK